MAYRRTENVVRRLAARQDAIVAAARDAAGEGGMMAVQIAPVAARAGIAAGTVYRYFPGKTDLVGALIASVSEREIEMVRRAAAMWDVPADQVSYQDGKIVCLVPDAGTHAGPRLVQALPSCREARPDPFGPALRRGHPALQSISAIHA